MTSQWNPVGSVDPKSLGAERLQLHYGAFILGSIASALLPASDDDSHSNLGLESAGRLLATHPLDEEQGIAFVLLGPDLELALRRGAETVSALPLPGKTVDEALAWASEAARGALPAVGTIERRSYPDFPSSPLAEGGAFDAGDARARRELAHWFGNAQSCLEAASANEASASDIRVWPHHFDVGILINLGGERGIGVGMSPGDGNHDEPYFYVYGYPYPDPVHFPDLEAEVGSWTRKGFTGALLTATEVVATADPAKAAAGFLREAIGRCRTILG